MRNLNKTLAIVSLLAPASAHPLGVGDIKLHSALNQRLNAEIPLIVSKSENPANIRVSLASPEKFDEAGVPWSYFLSKIKFKPQVRRDGSVVIKVTSDEVLREPFLDFLLEVTWDKGNLYREFTVLIDPPSSYTQPVVPVAEPAVSSQTASKTPAPSSDSKTPHSASTIRVENELSSGAYGPTHRNETLWDIAKRLRPRKDISIEQMIIALYEANPHAFYKDNVNALMAGKKLKVPDVNSIVKISRRQAAKLFRQQYKAWTQKTASAAQKKQAAGKPGAGKTGQQLELVAPAQATVEAGSQVTAQAENTEAKTATPAKTAPGNTIPENGADNSLEKQELVARLEKLEQQLAVMQQMLAVKDAQLAVLQHQEKATQTAAQKAQQAPETGQAKQQTATATKKPVNKAAKPPVKAVQKPVKKQPSNKIKQPEPVAEEPGFFDDFYYLIVGGGSLLILGLLAWLWVRKRQSEEELDTEDMFSASSQIVMPDSELSDAATTFAADQETAYDVGTVGESSFLSEFTPSDFDAFDAEQSEVDPIAEADVYLAYGRYQQAEELMRQAVKDHPERKECKLKLLEIFYASENKDAFNQYVEELLAEGLDKDADFWDKVKEMQQEFGGEEGGLAAAAASLDATGDSALSEPEEVTATSLDLDDVTESPVLDDAADFKQADEAGETGDILDLDALEDLDFDLGALGDDSNKAGHDDATPQEDIETLDFNLASGSDESVAEASEKTTIDQANDELDLETFDFQPATDTESSDKDITAEHQTSTDSDDDSFDFDFNFEESSFEVKDEKGEAADAGVSDLTDMDEFETKLDLAKAYIDMGDIDAAKAIVQEVQEQGNDEQKQAAQKIMDSL